jgi:pyruvate carboxylase
MRRFREKFFPNGQTRNVFSKRYLVKSVKVTNAKVNYSMILAQLLQGSLLKILVTEGEKLKKRHTLCLYNWAMRKWKQQLF